MSDDGNDDLGEYPGSVHLHRLAERDDWHRVRVLLSALWAITDGDWRCDLQSDLVLEVLHVATCASGIEVTAGDVW